MVTVRRILCAQERVKRGSALRFFLQEHERLLGLDVLQARQGDGGNDAIQ
jgi:hypothetical protein